MLPNDWNQVLEAELRKPSYLPLQTFLASERRQFQVFPPERQVFAALELTSFQQIKTMILGQDPYHDDGQAHGLSFSVPPGVKRPPSLVNIFKELHADLNLPIPQYGCLDSWAGQGVFLLNTVLTVRAHEPNSHRNQGWETFTDGVINKLNERDDPVIFVLWGKPAQTKKRLIDAGRHLVLEAAHPSPFSARNGFFGTRPFSKINQQLRQWGKAEINWNLPE